MTKEKKPRRVRWTLLVLLWIWAITIFATLDLFTNVGEFDTIRPRAAIYRGMRIAAHKMIGEPIAETASSSTAIRAKSAAVLLAEKLDLVRSLEDWDSLGGYAANGEDPRVRILALRTLVQRFGARARDTLVRTARDNEEILKVRRHAARLVGRTGSGAAGELEAMLDSKLPLAVRGGAVFGLGELSTAAATERLLAYAADPKSRVRPEALAAIERISGAEAAPLLRHCSISVDKFFN